MMDIRLDSSQRAFQAEIRTFLRDNLTEDMKEGQRRTTGIYADPDISLAWQRRLNARGWAAPSWPKSFGGTGWSAIERFIFESECALAGAPVVYPIGIRLVAPVIMAFGNEQQQRDWLPPILSGEDYWCQGFSEPGAGSDLAALSTRAVADGGDYVVNGSKIWTTHAHHANWVFALVRTADTARRQDGISFLAIPLDTPGIEVRPIISIGGDHDVNEIFLTDVRVPQAWRIGEENKGWAYAKYLLEFERGNGLFSSRLRSSLKRIEAATAGDLSVSDQDKRAERVAEVALEIDIFEMLELMTLGLLPAGTAPGPLSSVLKLRASRLKQSVARLGFDLLGPTAMRRSGGEDDPLTQIIIADYLNSRAATIFGGTSEVQLGIIAKTLAGL